MQQEATANNLHLNQSFDGNEPGAFIRPLVDDRNRFDKNKEAGIKINPDAAQEVFFKKTPTLVRDLIELCNFPISGFSLQKNVHILSNLGAPLEVIAAKVVVLRDREWQFPALARCIQPLKFGTDQLNGGKVAFIPFRGEIFFNGKPLDDEIGEKIGIHNLHTINSKEEVFIPAYRIGGRGLMLPVLVNIPVMETEQGGFRIPTSEEYKQDWKVIKGIAIQYCGVGSAYSYNVREKNDSGFYETELGEVEFPLPKEDPRFTRVIRNIYQGQEGIFIDQQHESYADAPTGGTSVLATEKDIRLDQLLWAHGAEMAGVKLSSINLLDKSRIDSALGNDSRMPCEGLSISIRIYFRDTHRLSAITAYAGKDNNKEGEEIFKRLIKRDYGDYTKEFANQYLNEISRNLGKNIRICLNLGITLKQNQVSADNLGLYGGILDSENFFEMTNRFQIRPLIDLWLRDLVDLHCVAGICQADFFNGPSYKAFIEEILEDEVDQEVIRHGKLDQSSPYAVTLAALDIARLWALHKMHKQNLHFDIEDLIRIYWESDSLQKRLKVPLNLIDQLNEYEFLKFLIDLTDVYMEHMIILHEPQFGGGLTPDIEILKECKEVSIKSNDL